MRTYLSVSPNDIQELQAVSALIALDAERKLEGRDARDIRFVADVACALELTKETPDYPFAEVAR